MWWFWSIGGYFAHTIKNFPSSAANEDRLRVRGHRLRVRTRIFAVAVCPLAPVQARRPKRGYTAADHLAV